MVAGGRVEIWEQSIKIYYHPLSNIAQDCNTCQTHWNGRVTSADSQHGNIDHRLHVTHPATVVFKGTKGYQRYTSPPRYVQVFQAFDARLLDVISVSGRRPWCLKETGSRIEASWRLECGMNSGTMILRDFTMPKTAKVEGILWGIVQAHQRLAWHDVMEWNGMESSVAMPLDDFSNRDSPRAALTCPLVIDVTTTRFQTLGFAGLTFKPGVSLWS